MATAHASPLPDIAQKSAEATQALHDDIRTRWDRLTDLEVGHLESADDLATQIAARYNLDIATVELDVAEVLKGRQV